MIVNKRITKKRSVKRSKMGGGINYYSPEVLAAVNAYETNSPNLKQSQITPEYVNKALAQFRTNTNTKTKVNQNAAIAKRFGITSSNTNTNLSRQIAKKYAANTSRKANEANTTLGKRLIQEPQGKIVIQPNLTMFRRKYSNANASKTLLSRLGSKIKGAYKGFSAKLSRKK